MKQNEKNNLKLVVATMLILLFLWLCLFGCAGEQRGKYFNQTVVATERIPVPATVENPEPKPIIKTTTTTTTTAEGVRKAPKGVKEQKGFSVGPKGINSDGSTTWQLQIDGLTQNSWMFYGAGILLVSAGVVVASWLKQYVLGIALVVGGMLSGVAPTVIPIVGPWIAVLIVLAIILGITYVVGKYVFGWQLKAAGQKAVAKLRSEGKILEATAIRRATDPKFDKAFIENKELNGVLGLPNIPPPEAPEVPEMEK